MDQYEIFLIEMGETPPPDDAVVEAVLGSGFPFAVEIQDCRLLFAGDPNDKGGRYISQRFGDRAAMQLAMRNLSEYSLRITINLAANAGMVLSVGQTGRARVVIPENIIIFKEYMDISGHLLISANLPRVTDDSFSAMHRWSMTVGWDPREIYNSNVLIKQVWDSGWWNSIVSPMLPLLQRPAMGLLLG